MVMKRLFGRENNSKEEQERFELIRKFGEASANTKLGFIVKVYYGEEAEDPADVFFGVFNYQHEAHEFVKNFPIDDYREIEIMAINILQK